VRIGIVSYNFYPSIGGGATFAALLSGALSRNAVDVEVIAPLCSRDAELAESFARSTRLKIHWVVSDRARGYSDYFSRAIFFLKMVRRIQRLSTSVDLFHAHEFHIGFLSALCGSTKPVLGTFGADPLYEMFFFGRERNKPYADFVKSVGVRMLSLLFRWVIGFLSRGKDVALVSYTDESFHRRMAGRYFHGKIHHIPLAVPPELFDIPGCRRSGGGGTILFSSRLVSWKRVDVALAVFSKLREKRKDLRLIVLGTGPRADLVGNERQRQAGINHVPSCRHDEIGNYLAQATVFIAPSDYETFGTSVLEAMAAGVPIVAANLDVYRDRLVHGENAFLVTGDSVREYCDHIEVLLDDPSLRKRFSSRTRERARSFELNRVAERYMDVYRQMVPSQS